MPSRLDARGSMPAGAIIAVALAIAAVIGLIVGAIWGQTTGGDATAPTSSASVPTTTAASSAPAPSDTTTAPSPTDTAPTDSGSPPSTSPASTPPPSVSPPSAPTGSAPPAPATTTTSADGWRLGSWKVTNTGGTLGIDTTARNTATGTRSATLVLYVYVNGALIATTTAAVTDVPAGGTVPVHFAGTDPWQPGNKVLLLATA